VSRSYTSARREHEGVKPSFELDGVEFVCEGGVTTLDISEFAQIAKTGIDTDDPAAAAVFAEFFQNALGPTVYATFKRHTRAHGTDDEVFVDIMQGIIEDFLGRPTGLPSSSHDGQSTTGPGSNPGSRVVSLQTGTVQFRPAPTPGATAAVQAAGSSIYQPEHSSTPYTRSG
jgi:hypothetical protein